MDNPLSQLLEVDERQDGVYIKVTSAQKDQVSLGALEKILKVAQVVNYDLEAILGVLSRGGGTFEKIGPLFEYYDTQFDSFISVQVISPLKASMKVSSESIVSGLKATEEIIRHALARQGIKYGIKKEGIKKFITEAAFDTEFVVAEGIAPENGIDGKIEVQVDLNPDSTPKVDESGRTDYREIKTFVVAKQGQVLAKRIPPQVGKPGKSISGKEIPSQMGNDVRLPAGKNTDISKDGQWLSAKEEGIVFLDSGLICVGEMLNISGDVDFSVGNIKYTGDIIVQGNVKPGFTVESEGDIEIKGEVESARVISRKGFVTIGRGVIGKDDTEIYGANGVSVGFSQGSTIKTDGKLTVDKYLLHCQLTCSVLETTNASSGVIGGKLTVYDRAVAVNIGNDKNVETLVSLVDKNRNKAKEKLEELVVVREKIQKQLQPISRELKTKTMIIKKVGGNATLRQREELKKWVDSYNSLNMKVKYIDKKEAEIKAQMSSPTNYNGFIKVSNTIYPGVKLDMYGVSHKDIKGKMTNKTFKLVDNLIEAEG